MAVSKLALIGSGGVGVSAATAGGVALYLTSGETLKEHISKVIPSNRQFISLVSGADTHLEKKYKLGTEDKKPVKGGKVVEKILDWCKDSENIKFSSESDRTYVLFSEWCFVNTNTLLTQAKYKNKTYISDKDGNDKAWKDAWTAYNTNKEKDEQKLKITDDDLKNLNQQSQNEGAVDLHKWCTRNGTKKMYEAEANYSRYEKWCFKAE